MAVELTADSLRKLYEHIMAMIENENGEYVVGTFKFYVVIMVPAIWKGYVW